MSTHVKILGWLLIVYNAFVLMMVLLVGGAVGLAGIFSGEADGAMVGGLIGAVIATVGLVLAVPGIVVGWGLLNYKNWARILGIILAILNLLSFPIGTAISIYALWVLFNDEVAAAFRRGGPAYGT